MIDGFNTIITLEVMLCGGILFECMDGTIRDLAALRGTYRIIPQTEDAIRMMCDIFQTEGLGDLLVSGVVQATPDSLRSGLLVTGK